jgi:putative ABC transport system permease protein
MIQLLPAIFIRMYFLLAFLALPSLIAMLNTLVINVFERTREIGMIRAVASNRKEVRQKVVAEVMLLASVGTAVWILSGMYLGYVIVKALGTLPN